MLFMISLLSPPALIAQEKEQEKNKKQKQITEEIVVEAKRPKDVPLSTTSIILKDKIEALQPRDISDVLSYSSGTFVSAGAKNEFRLKIRGFEGQRIVLLYDGIPIYEPFFNSFDRRNRKRQNRKGSIVSPLRPECHGRDRECHHEKA